MSSPNRRSVLLGAASLIGGAALAPARAFADESYFDPQTTYAAITTEPFPVAPIDLRRVKPQFLRTVVPFDSAEVPGTIVIDPAKHFLYVVNGDGRAIRYGVGVGREGFLWSGVAHIQAKREWPDWYPPKEMIARDPHTKSVIQKLQSGLGMPGGSGNPLGARAMYLFDGNRDTQYRIHGTVEPYSIGSSVSSGCIRMMNQDVLDLYERMPIGTKVIVLGNAHPSQEAMHAPRKPDPVDAADGSYVGQSGYAYDQDQQ